MPIHAGAGAAGTAVFSNWGWRVTTPTRIAALMGALIGLGTAAALYALRPTNAFTGLEWRIVDARTQAFMGQRKPDPDLVLADAAQA